MKVDENKVTDCGNSLSGYAYENNVDDSKQYIPNNLTEDTPILMEKDEYEISFYPVLESIEETKSEEELNESILDENELDINNAEMVEEEVENNNVRDSVTAEDETNNEEVEIDNNAIYSVNNGSIEIKYTSLDNGVKEEIILFI